MIDITPTPQFVNIDHNLTFLTTQLTGDQLGLKGWPTKKHNILHDIQRFSNWCFWVQTGPAANETLNVTMQLPVNWKKKSNCAENSCDKRLIQACVYFQAAKAVFPEDSR